MLTHVVKQFEIFINRFIEFMHVLETGGCTSFVFCNQFTLQMNSQNVHEANKLRDMNMPSNFVEQSKGKAQH